MLVRCRVQKHLVAATRVGDREDWFTTICRDHLDAVYYRQTGRHLEDGQVLVARIDIRFPPSTSVDGGPDEGAG